MTKLEQVALAIASKVNDPEEDCLAIARAAVEALRDVSFSILGAEPLEWNDVIDLILNEKDQGQIAADMLETGSCGFGQSE